jgi:hypothetical protein
MFFMTSVSDAQELRNIALEELWNIGGADDDDHLLKVVTSVQRDGSSVYFLDNATSKVYKLTIDGELIAVYRVDGEGPGECDNPADLIIFGGNQFGLVKAMPGRIIVSDLQGRPEPTIRFMTKVMPEPGERVVFHLPYTKYRHGYLVSCNAVMYLDRESKTTALSIFAVRDTIRGTPVAREQARVLEQEYILTFDMPDEADIPHPFNYDVWDISSDGKLYVVPDRHQYLVQIYDDQGKRLSTINQEHEPHRRSAQEKEFLSYMGEGEYMQVEDFEPAIKGLYVDENDHLWVRESRSDHIPGVYRQYQVFDEQGQHTQIVNLIYPGSSFRDDIIFLGDGLVAIIKGKYDFPRKSYFHENPNSKLGEEELAQVILCRMIDQ